MNKRYMVPGPFHGIISDLPSATDRQAFDTCLNFICRKGRLISRPALTTSFAAPPDGNPIKDLRTFQDVNGSWHTCVFTKANVYAMTAGWTYNLLTSVGDVGTATGLPLAILSIDNRLYYSNSSNFLAYTDGSSTLKIAGDVPGGPRFLAQNSGHTIGAAWEEISNGGNFFYGNRVRWSDVGNPNSWTVSPNTSAGVSVIQEVPDVITGLYSLLKYTYITRSNGFNVMYPTGNSSAPFSIEPLSISIEGIGNYYPYSLDGQGTYFVCVSIGDVIQYDGTNMNKLANGKAQKAILADIASATGTIIGRCFTALSSSFDFESYWLTIPGPNITWVFSFEEGTWTRINSSLGALAALNYVAVA